MTLMFCRILIAVVGSSAFVSGADSDSLVVMDMIVGERYVHSTARFDMSEESGRAWVEAIVDNGGIGDDYDSYTLRSKVQNLSYDAQTKETTRRLASNSPKGRLIKRLNWSRRPDLNRWVEVLQGERR